MPPGDVTIGNRPTGSPTVAPATLSAAPSDLTGLRVLVADDAEDNQMLIALYLQKAGAAPEIVDNGRQAVDRALDPAASQLDVILMDMQMPEMDGYEATAHLRKSGYRRPVIAITAHAMSSDRDRCLAAGCDDFVSKPVDRARLVALIARHANRASS